MGANTVGRGCYVPSASAAHRLVYVPVFLSPGCTHTAFASYSPVSVKSLSQKELLNIRGQVKHFSLSLSL
jgi:hypothetical protein